MKKVKLLSILLVCLLFCVTVNGADEKENKKLVTKVYPVSDLVTKIQDYPYQGGTLPTSGPFQNYSIKMISTGNNQMGLSEGGGVTPGSGGGFGGGGGGAFNVQDNIGQGQFHVVKGRRRVGRSPRVTGTLVMGQPKIDQSNDDELIKAITTVVDPMSWEMLGGPGDIVSLNSMLVVLQHAENHQKIEKLLDMIRSQSSSQKIVHLEAYWIYTGDELAKRFNQKGQLYPVQLENSVVQKMLSGKTEEKQKGFSAQLTCFNGQTVSMTSGQRRSLMQSITPVVGTDSMGYSPKIISLHSGIVLQVKPQLDQNRKTVTVDIQSVISKLEDSNDPSKSKAVFSDSKGKYFSLDEINLNVQELSTTVRIPLNKYVLVGGMTPSNNVMSAENSLSDSCSLIIRIHEGDTKEDLTKSESNQK